MPSRVDGNRGCARTHRTEGFGIAGTGKMQMVAGRKIAEHSVQIAIRTAVSEERPVEWRRYGYGGSSRLRWMFAKVFDSHAELCYPLPHPVAILLSDGTGEHYFSAQARQTRSRVRRAAPYFAGKRR